MKSIALEGVSKSFGAFRAVDNVSAAIPAAAGKARHVDDLPVICAVATSVGARERGLRPQAAEGAGRVAVAYSEIKLAVGETVGVSLSQEHCRLLGT